MLRWLVWLFVCTVFSRAQNVSFSIPYTTCNNNGTTQKIRCDHDAHDLNGHIELTKDLGSNGSTGTGYVFYTDRVRMLDPNTSRAASFSTNFTFSITKAGKNNSGDGMSFVMFADETYRGDGGGALGVYEEDTTQGTKTFCVEFDTWQNPNVDPSNNHVGVDLESVISNITAEAGDVGINLKGGYPITSWIDYDFSNLNLEVRIANASNGKPAPPLINFHLNLSDVVDEFMSIGFAASTGWSVEYHQLYSWNFAAFVLQLPPLESGKSKTGLIVGVSIGIASVVLLSCLLCGLLYRVLKVTQEDFQSDSELKFTYRQLSIATKGFSEGSKLGQGGSSSVYQGEMDIANSKTSVAVKRVANKAKQGEREFLAEIRVVSQLQHQNLVKLLGWGTDRRWCTAWGNSNYLLVYELMQKGSLDKLLFDDGGCTGVLSWAQRLTILRGVAAGLGYLHQRRQVIHGTIKSSNVMLDDQLHARVGDFGLARLIDDSKNLGMIELAGTNGYIAPEASLMSKSTDKMDVYAFGALILEVACGRRPVDTNAPQQETILVDWVWNCHAQGNLLRVADAQLTGNFPESEMERYLLTGLLCLHPDPAARPSMPIVEQILQGAGPLPPVPLTKPIFDSGSIEVTLLGNSRRPVVRIS